jgi:hypothetical protein
MGRWIIFVILLVLILGCTQQDPPSETVTPPTLRQSPCDDPLNAARPECASRVAILSGNATVCERLAAVQSAACVRGVALSTGNVSLCERIADAQQRTGCYLALT